MQRQITAGIILTGCQVSAPVELEHPNPLNRQFCVYFPDPGIFLHGTMADFKSFISQIQGKLALWVPPDPKPEISLTITPSEVVRMQAAGRLDEFDDDGPPTEWDGLEEMVEAGRG
jgi:hypothetical protein